MDIVAYQAKQTAIRMQILETSTRGKSAFALASMAIEHSGSGAHTAAKLLMSMEYGTPVNIQDLHRLDTTYRAHAEMALSGCIAHELWPSKWITEEGLADGESLMEQLRKKWS